MLYRAAVGERNGAKPATGLAYGAAVFAVGPMLLLPAMRIMAPPAEERVSRTATLAIAHALYGLTLSRGVHFTRRG